MSWSTTVPAGQFPLLSASVEFFGKKRTWWRLPTTIMVILGWMPSLLHASETKTCQFRRSYAGLGAYALFSCGSSEITETRESADSDNGT